MFVLLLDRLLCLLYASIQRTSAHRWQVDYTPTRLTVRSTTNVPAAPRMITPASRDCTSTRKTASVIGRTTSVQIVLLNADWPNEDEEVRCSAVIEL